jgi:hypothetical protein
MGTAVCWKCIKDRYLSEIIRQKGERLRCSVCDASRNSYSVAQLGEALEPVLREHIRPGREVRRFGDDDKDWYEQLGDPLSYWVQEVLGQYFDFEDEIIDAVVDAEDVDPQDGDVPFFDQAADYEPTRVSLREYFSEWDSVLQELKHERRFFSPSAQALFERLFLGVEEMRCWSNDTKQDESVVWTFPEGSELFRARTCDSILRLREFVAEPLKHVGPPPPAQARAGRMNVEGVVVFYGAIDPDTCLAEMRPALGGETALITLRTTRLLQLLDFTRLEKSHSKRLSYFQPDFSAEVQRLEFLRRLHNLISQPVVPGRESDYLITQTMAEYLAHVHREPFDGLLFKSVQRDGGVNVVLFRERGLEADPGGTIFPLSYVDGSFKLFSTQGIQYKHKEKRLRFTDGKVSLAYDGEDYPDDDDWLD